MEKYVLRKKDRLNNWVFAFRFQPDKIVDTIVLRKAMTFEEIKHANDSADNHQEGHQWEVVTYEQAAIDQGLHLHDAVPDTFEGMDRDQLHVALAFHLERCNKIVKRLKEIE